MSSLMKGVATEYSPYSHPESLENPMYLDGLDHIG